MVTVVKPQDMPALEQTKPSSRTSLVTKARLVCIDMVDLDAILEEVADLRELVCDLRDVISTDNIVLDSIDTAVHGIGSSMKQMANSVDEHQSDIDYLFKKVSLHKRSKRAFFEDEKRTMELAQTIAMMVMAVAAYAFFIR